MGRDNYWTRRRVSRRGFVQGASALTAFAGTAALVGCGDDDDDAPGTSAPTSSGTTPAGTTPGATTTSTAPAAGSPVYGGILRIPATTEPPDIDPTKTMSAGLHIPATPIYSKLIRTVLPAAAKSEGDFTLIPDLADSWEEVDLQTYTFKMNPNATWHDVPPINGRKVVAGDIKYAFDTYRAGGPQSPAFDTVDEITTPDDATVVIKLTQPFALFLDAVSNTTRQVFSREAVERPEGLAGFPIIGTGPFMYKNFDRGTSFEGVKNPNYFREGFPYLDGYRLLYILDPATRIASFRSGEIHAVGATPADGKGVLNSNPDSEYEQIIPQFVIYQLGSDLTKEPYSDPRVRRAISMAHDRKAAVDSLFDGIGITGWGIPWSFAQDMTWTEDQMGDYYWYNPAEAKKLMEAAGLGDGFKSSVIFPLSLSADAQAQVQLLQAELKANINVDMELLPMAYADHFNAVQQLSYEHMAYAYQIGSSASVDDFMYKNMHTGSGANFYRLSDAEIDKRVEQIRIEPDAEVRSRLVAEVHAIDMEMLYRIPEPQQGSYFITSPKYNGWRPNRLFRTSNGYGSDSFEESWLSA